MKICLYMDDNRPVAGVAMSMKKDRLRVLTARGREAALPHRRVLWSEGSIGKDPPTSAEALAALASLTEAAGRYRPDLEGLWELVSEEDQEYDIAELAELCFEAPSPAEILAMLQALCSDTLLFRNRAGRFQPRTVLDVEETKRQNTEAERRRTERAAVLTRMRELLEDRGSPEDVRDCPGATGLIASLRARILAAEEGGRTGDADMAAALGVKAGALTKALEALLVGLGVFRNEVEIYLARQNLPCDFPEALEAEAKGIERVESWPDREDLTGVQAFTIDDEGTEDLDDAISLTSRGDGWTLGIHIANPAFFVPRGGPLDEEAYNRGTTIYLPDLKVGMFPDRLAHDLMSLMPGQSRPTLTVEVELDGKLEIGEFRLIRSVIRSSARLTYEEADRLIVSGEEADNGPGESLRKIVEVAERLREDRIQNGALELSRPEVKIHVDRSGEVSVKPIDRFSPSRKTVSEMMILANRLAARFCVDREIPAIFRRQDPPDFPIPPDSLETYNPISHREAVRGLTRARISTIPDRHAGIGVDAYLQMSSPIRRYADLVMQRQIETYLTESQAAYEAEEILAVVATAEETSYAAIRAERERNNYWLHVHLAGRIGEPAEVYLLDSRNDGSWLVEMEGLGLLGRLAGPWDGEPGDLVAVEIAGSDPERRRLDFTPLR